MFARIRHIGLSTVTYLFSGEIMHRDSLGFQAPIRPQEVNWMTAGSGITHSERLEKARALGDRLHGIQAWVALPTEFEETAPDFTHYEGDDLPAWDADGVRGHLIAGSAYGLTSRARTHSPLFYAHLEMAEGATAGGFRSATASAPSMSQPERSTWGIGRSRRDRWRC